MSLHPPASRVFYGAEWWNGVDFSTNKNFEFWRCIRRIILNPFLQLFQRFYPSNLTSFVGSLRGNHRHPDKQAGCPTHWPYISDWRKYGSVHLKPKNWGKKNKLDQMIESAFTRWWFQSIWRIIVKCSLPQRQRSEYHQNNIFNTIDDFKNLALNQFIGSRLSPHFLQVFNTSLQARFLAPFHHLCQRYCCAATCCAARPATAAFDKNGKENTWPDR